MRFGDAVKRPEILYLIGSLERGGAEVHLSRIAPRLVEKGWCVTIACLSRRGSLADAVEQAGIRILAPPINLRPTIPRWIRLLSLLSAAARFFFYLILRRPYAVHMFLPTAYWIGGPIALLAGARCRIMSRRSRNHYLDNRPIARMLEQFLHRRMTLVLGNSKNVVLDLLREGADPARTRLIYNGVDVPPRRREMAVDRARNRTEFGFGQSLVIACVANLIPYKGHADLIDAMVLVQGWACEDWILLMIGRDDGIGSSLINRAEVAGLGRRIRFLGERADIQELLWASDVFVLPSHEEGFSNALLEAMAMELPIVATDVGGNSEAIEDRVSGMIVPPRNPQAMAAAIATMLQDASLRRAMGAAARSRVEEKFSLQSCSDEYDAMYRSLSAAGIG